MDFELSKEVFYCFINEGSYKSIVRRVSKEKGIPAKTVNALIKHYYEMHANELERREYQRIVGEIAERKSKNYKKHFRMFDQLLVIDDKDEIIKIISESNLKTKTEFFPAMTSYILSIYQAYEKEKKDIAKSMTKDQFSLMDSKIKADLTSKSDNLSRKFFQYEQYLNKENEKTRELKEEEKKQKEKALLANKKESELISNLRLLQNIASSKYQTSGEYLAHNGISAQAFSSAVRCVETKEPALFEAYAITMYAKMSNPSLGQENIGFVVKSILENPNFDILDYYLNTKVTPEELMKLCGPVLNSSSFNKLQRFLRTNDKKIPLDFDSELSGQHTIIINDTRIITTCEQKESAREYLIIHGVPLYTNLYKLALRRIVGYQKSK